jgi:lambda family phage portal protein
MPRMSTLEGGGSGELSQSAITYGAAELTNTTADFQGDWRAADSWMRFDMWRVRNRSRQMERGDPWCIGFNRNMLNNVLGYKGFHFKVEAVTGKRFGDSTDGEPDEQANGIIKPVLEEFGKPKNFTTRKRLSRRAYDRLALSRLIWDGEIILRKRRGFANDFNFAWQPINPDYLDHNRNQIEDNGNITRMGVELDKTDKFPVAYWFLKRRPNDFSYNWSEYYSDRYIRVPAEEVIHVFPQTFDEEQTRGFPLVFAAFLILFRLGKYSEAAVINAAIGASRGVFFEKNVPEGFQGDPKDFFEGADQDKIVLDSLPGGQGIELPPFVTAKVADMRYPDAEYEPFHNAMMLTAGMVFGTSYATTTGDLSKANFVSSRVGSNEEREHYMSTQQFLIEELKEPMYDEELYRAMLARKVPLPIGKFDKFNAPSFSGRRWKFVQPVDDWSAKEIEMDNCATSLGDVINETTGEDEEDVYKRIARSNKLLEKYGLKRVSSVGRGTPIGGNSPDNPTNPSEPDDPNAPEPKKKKPAKP